MPYKQVIVVRKDLGMRKGKMIAQGSHASMAFLVNQIRNGSAVISMLPLEVEWLFMGQKKIVVSVNSEQELIDIYNRSREAGIPADMIIDAGHTELSPETKTCIAIGPWHSEEIDKITGGLPLL